MNLKGRNVRVGILKVNALISHDSEYRTEGFEASH
jgi:hypothetical protein